MDLLSANDKPGEFPQSYYAATADLPAAAPALTGSQTFDVAIVGAGYTGLSAALHLAKSGRSVALLEAHRAGFGASGRNGGQVGTGQRRDQDDLEKMFGQTKAKALWKMGLEAVQLVKDLICDHKIECDFKDGIIHADHRARYVPESHAYAEKLRQSYGYDLIHPLDKAAICDHIGSDNFHGGTLDLGGGHLHPLNYALGLRMACINNGVQLFENTIVTNIEGTKITTAKGDLSANTILLAANGYLGGLNAEVAARVMPINNFILATEPLPQATASHLIRDNHAVADSRFVVNYWRLSSDNRLLFGGGESYGFRFPRDIKSLVRGKMLEVYPQLRDTRIDYAWGGTLGITMNRMPAFQRPAPNVISAAGFSGHGVAMATLAGKLMAKAIDGRDKGFDLFANLPQQNFPGGTALRWPLLVAAMTWYSLRDRL